VVLIAPFDGAASLDPIGAMLSHLLLFLRSLEYGIYFVTCDCSGVSSTPWSGACSISHLSFNRIIFLWNLFIIFR
jgi:hypothetical protein